MRPVAIGPDESLLAALRAVLPQGVELGPPDSAWAAARRALACDDAALCARIAHHHGIGVAVVGAPDVTLRRLVPAALARKLAVLPLRASGSVLTVATPAPGDASAESALAAASGRRVRFAIAAPSVVHAGLAALYPERDGAVLAATDRAAIERVVGEADARPVVRLVDEVIAGAVACGASDVHLECGEAGVVVRYRVDGVLREATSLARDAGVPVVSRIKIMSGLDIADRLRPQDGRARVTVGDRTLDLRVSTLPAANGEKVVIRGLDSSAATLSLDALGLAPDDAARLTGLLDAREGLVLVTGPTGSGKTTTLYSALRHVQRRGVNVVTVEDPVEYRLAGVSQVQVNERAGLTFAAALRSILRQDPDVVLVGEIRDRETAAIAVQAALTGHVVLSTLHTIDAAGAVARLADLGVEPFKLAAALRGVIAQRLVRRFCARCHAADATPARDGLTPPCDACSGSGYRGRVAVVELLVCTDEVSRAIARNAPIAAIVESAHTGGMRSLWECGLDHARRGITDEAELRRSLEPPAASPSSPAHASAFMHASSPHSEPLVTAIDAFAALPNLDDAFDLVPPLRLARAARVAEVARVPPSAPPAPSAS